MNTGRRGNRRNRGNPGNRGRGSPGEGPYTPGSGETRRGQVPSVPEENSAPGDSRESRPPAGPRGHPPQRGFMNHPPSGPRAIRPGGFDVGSSAGSSESHAGPSSNQQRAIQPSRGSWGDSSASSSRSYGGQPPYEPRAIQEHWGDSSASSSRSYGGQPPYEPRANPPRGGPRGGFPRGGTRGGSRPTLGSDTDTDGDPIFRSPREKAAPDPDPEVTAKEDEDASSSESTFAKASGQDLDLPLRPSYSDIPQGKDKRDDHFVLWTNYLRVDLDLKKEFFRYDVTIEPASKKAPALKNIRKLRQVYNILFEGERDFQVLGDGVATDYAKTLITCGRLYEQSLPHKRYEVVYRNELEGPRDDDEGTQSDERKNLVTVTYSGTVPIPELIRYIGSKRNDPSNFDARLEAIQAMNIVVAGSPNKVDTVFQAGQNKFFQYPRGDPEKKYPELYGNCDLGNGLIAVRGYYSSIRTSTLRILLNLNAQCSAFYPEINLLDLMHIFAGGPPIPERKLPELEAFIRKLRVSTVQITGERKTVTRQKTVWGFSHKYEQIVRDKKPVFNRDKTPKMTGSKGASVNYGSSDSITFRRDNVSPDLTSVREYFLRQYEVRLKSPSEPVVNCGTDESPVWIPPERLTVMPGQPYRGTLNDSQTTNMLTIAARGPAENARRITNDGVQVIGIQPQSATLGAFGISIDPEMLTVHGRLLSAPQIQYHQTTQMPDHGEWNVMRNQFYEKFPIPKWAILCLGGANIPPSATRTFQQILGSCGMGSTKPEGNRYSAQLMGVGDDDRNDNAIKNEMDKVMKAQIPILLVVLNTASAAIYARVKYWGDTTYGIHTVCVLEKKLLGYDKAREEGRPTGDGTYWANVLHKFNLKLGGINHSLESGLIDLPEKTMVVGIDVAHPAPGSMENAPSVVAMVASMNNACVRFPGSVRIQQSRQEIQKIHKDIPVQELELSPDGKEDMVDSSNIRQLMQERLVLYRQNNDGILPENILIYRDGVSESQYQAVLDLELKQIQVHCEKMYHGQKSAPPRITIIIVGKRHHTRFYPTNDAHADMKHGKGNVKLCNTLNGTVVDRGITMHKGWDFYLQAHSAIKGTAKPAHYVVIHDDIGLEAARVEKITHNLSYLYQRATKAVSYCTPAYYADLLCARGRAWLMKAVRRKDSETRFDFGNANNPAMTAHSIIKDSMFYV